jgi:hypothetical protein
MTLSPAAGLRARDEQGSAFGAGQQGGGSPLRAPRDRNCAIASYMSIPQEGRHERCVRPGRERCSRTGGKPAPRAISPHPNLVTRSGLRALKRALAESQQALKTAQAIQDANERRRALELTARDARYFAERVAALSRSLSPRARRRSRSAPGSRFCATTVVAKRSGSSARTRRILAPDPSPMCPRLPISSLESRPVRPWRWTAAKSRLSQSNRNLMAAGCWIRRSMPFDEALATALLGSCWNTLRASIGRESPGRLGVGRTHEGDQKQASKEAGSESDGTLKKCTDHGKLGLPLQRRLRVRHRTRSRSNPKVTYILTKAK